MSLDYHVTLGESRPQVSDSRLCLPSAAAILQRGVNLDLSAGHGIRLGP